MPRRHLHRLAAGLALLGLAAGLIGGQALSRTAAQGELTPISAANIGEVKPVLSKPGQSPLFSPDGTLLVTNNRYSSPRVWRTIDGTEVPLDLPAGYARAFSPDGTRLAIDVDRGISDTTLWDIATDAALLTLEGIFYGFSPDNSYLVTSGPDAWNLWDMATGQHQALLSWESANRDRHRWLRFSPDSRWLAWSGIDGQAHVWDLRASTEAAVLSEAALDGVFSADGAVLFTRKQGAIYAWNTDTWAKVQEVQTRQGSVLQLSVDGSILITLAQENGFVYAFAVDDQTISASGIVPAGFNVEPSSAWSYEPHLYLSPDGSLVCGQQGNTAGLWSRATEHQLPLLPEPPNITGAFFSADSALLFVQSGVRWDIPRLLSVYDTTTGTQVARLSGSDFALSPDGTTLAGTIMGGSVSQQFVTLYGVPDAARPVGQVLIPAHVVPDGINLRDAPDPGAEIIGGAIGDVVAGGRYGEYVYLADLDGWVLGGEAYLQLYGGVPLEALPERDSGQVAAYVPEPTAIWYPTRTPTPTLTPTSVAPTPTLPPLTPVATAPPAAANAITAERADQLALLGVLPGRYLGGNGDIALTWTRGSYDQPGLLRSWDVARMAQGGEWSTAVVDWYYDVSEVFALSPDGAWLAIIDQDDGRTIRVWDTHTGTEVATLRESLSPAVNIVFSPDSHLLATVTWAEARDPYHLGNGFTLWAVPSGEQIAHLRVNDFADNALVFSPDNTLVAVGGQAQVWEAATGTLHYPLPTRAESLVFSPDSAILYTLNQGAGRLWDMQTGEMIAQIGGEPETVLLSPDHTRLLTYRNAEGLKLWDIQSGEILATMDADWPVLAPDGRGWLAIDETGVLHLWGFADGIERAALSLGHRGGLALSPGGRLLAVGVKLVDLVTWTAITPPYSTYPVSAAEVKNNALLFPMPQFTADGTQLLVSASEARMSGVAVYGIPDAAHPGRDLLPARVTTSGVHLHGAPGTNQQVSGAVSGEIRVSGIQYGSLYLPGAGGWVWPDYVDLSPYSIADLPLMWPEQAE